MISACLIDQTVCVALQAQFPGFSITPVSVHGAPTDLVGTVGFRSGRGVGSLGVAASTRTLRRLSPEIGPTPLDHADWVGELANQALGRLKIHMARFGANWITSTPVVLRGMSMQIARTEQMRTFVIRTGDHLLSVWFDVQAFDLHEADAADSSAADTSVQPGESLFF